MRLPRDDWWKALINQVAARRMAPTAVWVERGQLYATWPDETTVSAVGAQAFSTSPQAVTDTAARLAAITVSYVASHPYQRADGEYGWWDGVRTAVRYLYEQDEQEEPC